MRLFECTSLTDEIAAQPAPPCERFKCAKQRTCAVNGWACLAFVEYVDSGKVRRPQFRNPLEGPNSELFYERLGMRVLPRPQEKPKFNLPMRKITDG